MTERDEALALANRLLDEPNADPDDDLRVLSRQLLRMAEHVEVVCAASGFTLPLPMLLTCPLCHQRHVDEGEFATKPHHTHSCQHCGLTWRPAVVPTVGVQFLPGFKNTTPPTAVSGCLSCGGTGWVVIRAAHVTVAQGPCRCVGGPNWAGPSKEASGGAAG